MSILLDEVDLPLVCGCQGFAAVLLETFGRRAALGSVTGTLRGALLGNPQPVLDDWELILLLVEVLAASCCALAYCLLDLRLSTGAVRIAALAACASAPRSAAVFNLCITVAGTGLHTIRVVLDKIVDVMIEIRESLPGVTAVAVLLVQILVRSESRC